MSHCVVAVQKEVDKAGKAKRRYGRIAKMAEGVATLAMQTGALSSLAGGAVPILAIILPVILPLVALAAKTGQDRWQQKAKGADVVSQM
jgi:hypothetical protein